MVLVMVTMWVGSSRKIWTQSTVDPRRVFLLRGVGVPTLVIFGEIGCEVEQQVDHLRCAQLERTDDDWTANELGVTIVAVADQVTLVDRVHLFLTCPITTTHTWQTLPLAKRKVFVQYAAK